MYKQSILIIGKGYIGNNLYNYLSCDKPDNIFIATIEKDVINYHDSVIFRQYLKSVINETSEQVVVINCAGYTGRPNVDACEKPENKLLCWDLNATLPMRLGSICKELGVKFLHVSSGCIYNGYDKHYNEDDEPNFGLMSDISSFYSKTKHAGEVNLRSIDYGKVIRIRMPFCNDLSNPRNFIYKITKYTRLISMENSLTCVEDLCEFISRYINEVLDNGKFEIFNVVNQGISTTRAIAGMIGREEGWIFCDEASLELAAKRSNTILSTEKIKQLGLQLPEVNESLLKCIQANKQCIEKASF